MKSCHLEEALHDAAEKPEDYSLPDLLCDAAEAVELLRLVVTAVVEGSTNDLGDEFWEDYFMLMDSRCFDARD